MLHFIAAHKVAAVLTSLVIAGGIGGAAAKKSSDDAAHAKAQHALVVKHQQEAKAARIKAAKVAAAKKAAAEKAAAQEAAHQTACDTFLKDVNDVHSGLVNAVSSNFDAGKMGDLFGVAERAQTDTKALQPFLSGAQVVDLQQYTGSLELLQEGITAFNAQDYYTANADLSNAAGQLKSSNFQNICAVPGSNGLSS